MRSGVIITLTGFSPVDRSVNLFSAPVPVPKLNML